MTPGTAILVNTFPLILIYCLTRRVVFFSRCFDAMSPRGFAELLKAFNGVIFILDYRGRQFFTIYEFKTSESGSVRRYAARKIQCRIIENFRLKKQTAIVLNFCIRKNVKYSRKFCWPFFFPFSRTMSYFQWKKHGNSTHLQVDKLHFSVIIS